MRHTLTAAMCLAIIQAVATGIGAVAAERCELAVTDRPYDALAYKWQGDRCEGRYVERLSGAAIAFVSFTSAFQDYDLRAGNALTVKWAAPQDNSK